jgi:hypothetical protein
VHDLTDSPLRPADPAGRVVSKASSCKLRGDAGIVGVDNALSRRFARQVDDCMRPSGVCTGPKVESSALPKARVVADAVNSHSSSLTARR